MNPKLFVGLALLAIASQANSACLCAFGEGRDMCTGGSGKPCSPLVVRPAKLPRLNLEDLTKPRVVCKQIGGLPGLKPVGDLCSCRQSIVVPALVPRPACAACASNRGGGQCASCSSSSSNNFGSSSSSSSSNYFSGGSSCGSSSSNSGGGGATIVEAIPYEENYAPAEPIYTAAADPVSLSLAYKLQNQACGGISEDKLAFGFRKLPIDGSAAKIQKNVPEENLFRVNGQIVELKPVSCKGSSVSVDDEALEDLVAEEFAENEETDDSGVKRLSYGEIGFGPAKIKTVPFISVDGIGDSNPQPIQVGTPSRPCNDGFVSGNVIIKNIPQREIYTPGPSPPSDCDSNEDISPIRFVSSYSSSAASSSSSSNQASSSYTFGGCGN